jgi:hypothetical protein
MWFIVPAFGRVELARICLRQLRRTCDQLAAEGIDATAVVISDDENRDTALDLGFAHVTRGNEFVSQRFNDGIQVALDPYLTDAPLEAGRYEVLRPTGYRGHARGSVFQARLAAEAERRAVIRGDINVLSCEPLTFAAETFMEPEGWDGRPADYVVPCGSDDWVDHRMFSVLPGPSEVMTFRLASFVSEDGREIASRRLGNLGGAGIRIYPRQVLAAVKYRPADEDRKRACDTSILVNVMNAGPPPTVREGDLHAFQIVDWKTPGEQLNDFHSVTSIHRQGKSYPNPFSTLTGVYPDDAIEEMRAHYRRTRQPRTVAA